MDQNRSQNHNPPTRLIIVKNLNAAALAAILERSGAADGDLIFFRNRAESEQESVAALVQQTTMYYQDRLSGGRFTRVLVGGLGRGSGAVDLVRRSIEDRLGVSVEAVNPTAVAQLTNRIDASPEIMDRLGPLVGISLRGRARGAAA